MKYGLLSRKNFLSQAKMQQSKSQIFLLFKRRWRLGESRVRHVLMGLNSWHPTSPEHAGSGCGCCSSRRMSLLKNQADLCSWDLVFKHELAQTDTSKRRPGRADRQVGTRHWVTSIWRRAFFWILRAKHGKWRHLSQKIIHNFYSFKTIVFHPLYADTTKITLTAGHKKAQTFSMPS